jgi:RNA polymerase sigma-70 factor (ECF subfamily)
MREQELDDVTLAKAMRGEDAARIAFVRRHERLVFTVIARVVGASSSEVDDLAQESFLRALRALARFDATRGVRLSTWASTIAVRTAIDHVRRRARWVSLDVMRSEGRSPEGVSHADETSLDTKREALRLRDALAELSPEHRAIVVLRFEAELSLEEIARELDLELGTVKSRLSRAREALKSAVRPREALLEGT